MNTWRIRDLKEDARIRFKANRWKAIFVGMIATLITGGAAGIYGISSTGNTARFRVSDAVDIRATIQQIPASILLAFGVVTIFALISIVILAFILRALLLNPLEIGCKRFFYRNLLEDAEIKEICYSYDKGYKNGVRVLFFRDLYIILWTMLFIIPGIIKSYEYFMVPYILADNPEMDMDATFALSKSMMKGNKMNAFLLDLSFILWDIFGIITFGLGNIFYVNPYRRLAEAGLYLKLKK